MNTIETIEDKTRKILLELGFQPKHTGYKALCIAIPLYAQNQMQRMTKEMYPYLSKLFDYRKRQSIERAMRYSITLAWERGDPEVWSKYFLAYEKTPSNLVFIATLAEYLK